MQIIDKINELFLEAIEGVRVIRAFNKQQREIDRFAEVNEESSRTSRKSIALSTAMYPIVTTISGIASVATVSVSTPLIKMGQMEAGSLIAVIQYINIFLIAVILTLNVASLFPDANACFKRINEATSNVDAHTEQTIQNAMATLMKGRTSFVIAHRLSTIRDAAMILYMENGDIKEVGDHDTLMAKGGKYAELYNSQFA